MPSRKPTTVVNVTFQGDSTIDIAADTVGKIGSTEGVKASNQAVKLRAVTGNLELADGIQAIDTDVGGGSVALLAGIVGAFLAVPVAAR